MYGFSVTKLTSGSELFAREESLLPWLLYCIVVGSRQLMPPDALQPKAYCTNPGL